jgi:hypothetical protein
MIFGMGKMPISNMKILYLNTVKTITRNASSIKALKLKMSRKST